MGQDFAWWSGEQQLKECHVCDRSGQTKLTLWEEKIVMVQESKSHHKSGH